MTERVLDEAGLLPAGRCGRGGAGDADGRGPPRRGAGLRHGVHLRALERQGGIVARRRRVRGDQPDADRHGRNQSQHPPSADHRIVGDHHAPPLRRPVHAGHRSRRRGDVRRVRHPGGDDRADGGLRAGHAPAVARRGDLQPRRADRQVPGPVPRSRLQGGHPAGAGRVRARTLWRWAAGRSTTSSCTPTSRRRRCSAASRP